MLIIFKLKKNTLSIKEYMAKPIQYCKVKKKKIVSGSIQKPSKQGESEKVLSVKRKQTNKQTNKKTPPIKNSIVCEMIFKSKGKMNTSSDKQKLGKEYDKAV